MSAKATHKKVIILMMLVLTTSLIFRCSNQKAIIKPEKIILGLELGMNKRDLFDSLQKKITTSIISEITSDYDKSNKNRRFSYPFHLLNSYADFELIVGDYSFLEDKLIQLSCIVSKTGPSDSCKVLYNDLLDLYRYKYADYKYVHGDDKYFHQPKYEWSKDDLKITFGSMLSSLKKYGDNYEGTLIKDYNDIRSFIYEINITISYSNEYLIKNKRDEEQRIKSAEENIIERRKYQKVDSLSKYL